jgi:tetratricopeptide (TPR) repeat protein
MQYWAKLPFLIITVLAASLTFGQMNDPSHGLATGIPNHVMSTLGMIIGSVRDTSDKPLKDAHVEIRNVRTGQNIGSTYSNAEGQFEIDQVPTGTYEVVVTNGLAQDRQEIAVEGVTSNLRIRLATGQAADQKVGNNSSVSVAQMEVPKKARQHYEKAAEEVKKSRFEEAAKELEAALAIDPHYSEALTLRGVLKMDQSQMQEALSNFQEAISSDPNYAMAYVAAGSAYNALGQYDNAARALERGQELDPHSWQAHFEMAKTELGRVRYEVALREINRALDIAPEAYPPMHLLRAHIYLGQKNYPEAVTELEAYLQKAPQDASADQARKTLDQVKAFAAAQK